MKKIILILFLIIVTGCSQKPVETSSESTKEATLETTLESTAETNTKPSMIIPKEDDIGMGPAILDITYGIMVIPEGIYYEVDDFYATAENPFGLNTIEFGSDKENLSAKLQVTSMIYIESLEHAAEECIKRNDFGHKQSETKEDIIVNGVTYKHIVITDDKEVTDYLVTVYEYDNYLNYVEISFEINWDEGLSMNDPLSQELINNLKIPK